jgi:hypothetical protein
MKKVAVIMLGGEKQGNLFWPSYFNCDAGYPHDLILVHRDYLGVPTNLKNPNGRMIIHNKIVNGRDIPHRAFGAYRHFFYKYRDDYEYFIFISDDVILKRLALEYQKSLHNRTIESMVLIKNELFNHIPEQVWIHMYLTGQIFDQNGKQLNKSNPEIENLSVEYSNVYNRAKSVNI